MPTVSVVVPTYNRANLLRETLQSVAEQSYTDFECIVIDDGSTDHTKDVAQDFYERDPRFRYVWQDNSSASVARNRGLSQARGEFVCFLDSDDLFAEDRLSWQVQELRNDPEAVFVYGETLQFRNGDIQNGTLYLSEETDKPSGWAFHCLMTSSSIFSPLIRTSAIRETGGFDADLHYAEDWDMWLSLAKKGKLIFRPKIATYYRVHDGNKSLVNSLEHFRSAKHVVEKHLQGIPLRRRLKLYPRARSYLRQGYSPRLRRQASHLAHQGRWDEARNAFRALGRLDPSQLLKRWVLVNVLWSYLLPASIVPPWVGRKEVHR